jgi:hypothetical protein
MFVYKKWHSVALIFWIIIVILNYILPQHNSQRLIAIQAFQSNCTDSFVLQHQILNLDVSTIPKKLQSKIDAEFCSQQFGIPQYYFPTHEPIKSQMDTIITYQNQTELPTEMRTTFTEKYNAKGQIMYYKLNGQQDVYEATYNYNSLHQISLITEMQGAVSFEYDNLQRLSIVTQLDKNFKAVKKVEFRYIHI